MAVNQVVKKKRSNNYKNCPRAILNVVPINISKIIFSDLVPGEDYQSKAIIGKVCHLYPLGKRVDGETRKILVTDALDESENSDRKLSVFLFDQYAKDSVESSEIDGYIIITNFIVKNAPKKTDDMPVQVLVKRNESQVWFGRKVRKKEKKKSETPADTKKKTQSEDEEAQAVSNHHYEYSKLGDLVESEEHCNVYGIVDKCDLKITQGRRKQILELLLTDQTEACFSCSVFAAEDEVFPDIYPGDVARIHRMQVYKFRNKLKGRCASPKFILVFGKESEADKPRTVAKTFTFTSDDISRARELLEWNKTKNDPKLICEVQKDDFVNVICQVIGVYIAKSEAVILKIWDGTKTNEFPGVHLGFKEEKLDHRLFTVARSYYVNLFVYGHHIATASELVPGNFIEIKDAHLYSSKYNPEEYKLTLHAGNKEERGIIVLPESDERVIELKERLEKIISDTLEFGNQTDHILSQNNSMFLNCDISVFDSQKAINGEAAMQTGEEHGLQNGNAAENPNDPASAEDISVQENTDVEVLNEPLNKQITDPLQEKTVVSVVDISIKPGQSTQEFGRMPPDTSNVPEERISVSSEPDPICNLTPLQTRYFFHDPQQSATRITDSIFPTYTNPTQEDWWNSVPTVSVTDQHSDIKPSTLAEVEKHSVPYKFRVLAAVFSFKPNTSSIHKFIHLYCPNCLYISEDALPPLQPFESREGLSYYFCPLCKEKEANQELWPVLKYTFILTLSLHDGSGPPNVDVYLWKENAVKFFKGITPEEALRDSGIADSILHLLWSICPNCKPFSSSSIEAPAGYPILDCCILSYTAVNETRYQMFDTILL